MKVLYEILWGPMPSINEAGQQTREKKEGKGKIITVSCKDSRVHRCCMIAEEKGVGHGSGRHRTIL